MESHQISPADGCTGGRAGGRSPRHQRHRARAEKRLSLVRLPGRVRPQRLAIWLASCATPDQAILIPYSASRKGIFGHGERDFGSLANIPTICCSPSVFRLQARYLTFLRKKGPPFIFTARSGARFGV